MKLKSLRNVASAALAILLTASAVNAEPWKGQGLSWNHSSGWSIEIPAAANPTVETTVDDDISISGKTLDYNAVFRCYTNKAEADTFESALRKTMGEANVTFKPASTFDAGEWVCTATEGGGKTQEFTAEVTIGQLAKGGKYLVFMTTSDLKDHDQVDPLMGEIVKGVHVK
jgi:hypothetical protein